MTRELAFCAGRAQLQLPVRAAVRSHWRQERREAPGLQMGVHVNQSGGSHWARKRQWSASFGVGAILCASDLG